MLTRAFNDIQGSPPYWCGMTGDLSRLLIALGAIALIPAALAAMPPASDWEIGPWVRGKNYSVGMQDTPRAGPQGAVVIDFPLAGEGEWDALTTRIGSLEGVATITVRYRIDAAPGVRFVAVETPQEPASVSLYFQRAGDNWTGRGKYGSYRWYSPQHSVTPLAVGEHSIAVRLDDRWGSVDGKPSELREAAFADAKANAVRIGLAFGSASRRSHGVAATAPARFTLLSVEFD